jgi:hypothetical protein
MTWNIIESYESDSSLRGDVIRFELIAHPQQICRSRTRNYDRRRGKIPRGLSRRIEAVKLAQNSID